MATITLPASGWVERPYQRRIWTALMNGCDRAIVIAHRRWGKDDVALHHTAIAAHERVATYWHCLPEYAQARKAIWAAVNPHTGRRRIDEAFPQELREKTLEDEMFIRFRNGSTWQVIGSDRYDTTVGSGPAGIVYSEWALANPSAWGYHRPMLEENGGWALFITTPRGRNHAKTMYEMAERSPRWFAEISNIYDTGQLSAEQIEEALEEYVSIYGEEAGRAQFEQEYECSFNAAIIGAFYAREMLDVRRSGRILDIESIPGAPVHTAWDIGVRDSTCIWWFQVDGAQIRILDVYVAHGAGIEHYAEVCHSKPWPRGIDYVPHDARVREFGTGRTRIETMMQHGLNPEVVPQMTLMDGINAARQTLPLCVFHPRTEEAGIAALEQYRREWDDERKTFKASPMHDWTSHPADAFRYLAAAWRKAPREEPKKAEPTPHELSLIRLPGAPESDRGPRRIEF